MIAPLLGAVTGVALQLQQPALWSARAYLGLILLAGVLAGLSWMIRRRNAASGISHVNAKSGGPGCVPPSRPLLRWR